MEALWREIANKLRPFKHIYNAVPPQLIEKEDNDIPSSYYVLYVPGNRSIVCRNKRFEADSSELRECLENIFAKEIFFQGQILKMAKRGYQESQSSSINYADIRSQSPLFLDS